MGWTHSWPSRMMTTINGLIWNTASRNTTTAAHGAVATLATMFTGCTSLNGERYEDNGYDDLDEFHEACDKLRMTPTTHPGIRHLYRHHYPDLKRRDT